MKLVALLRSSTTLDWPTHTIRLGLAIIVLSIGRFVSAQETKEEPPSPPERRSTPQDVRALWEKEVRPILAKHCLECHNSWEASGKLDLESLGPLLKGGMSGSTIDREHPDKSLLLEVLPADAKRHMPPEGQLDSNQIAVLHRWVHTLAKTEAPTPVVSPKETSVSTAKDLESTGIPRGVNPTLVIDLLLESQWKKEGLEPSPMASDEAWIRRVSLDLIGRIPTDSERKLFIESNDSLKRARWIDQLLATEEHAEFMASWWDAMLIGRTNVPQAKRGHQMGWHTYLKNAVQVNKPWNEIVRDLVLAKPSDASDRGAVWYLYARKDKHQDIAEAVSRDLFGVRIDCAQCHDHPLASEIEQKHYWGLVAFFNRSKNVDTPQGPRISESAIGGFSEYTNIRGKSAPNELVFLNSERIDEARPAKDVKEEDRDELYWNPKEGEPKEPKFSRRRVFAEKVVAEHPLVARAFVNRMWGWMFGRGLVHPIDAMDSFHPCSHPELLAWLSRDFEEHGYDVRRLIRSMAMSRAYQLESKASSNVDPKYFSYYLTKPLVAESFYRSLQTSLGLDEKEWNVLEKRIAIQQLFPDVLAEESLSTVAQGLWLSNGESISRAVSVESSEWLRQVASLDPSSEKVRTLFRRILGRVPTEDEQEACQAYLEKTPGNKGVEGLVWSLVTSAEFRFNH